MAQLKWKGNTAKIKTAEGEVVYTIKRVKGLITYNILREDGSILKGGFCNIPQAKGYIVEWISGWK